MIIMKPRLFNQESKMRLINQKLYKKVKLNIKKIRIQQQTPPPININVNTGNTGFETNRRIKDIYKRLELLAPEENVKDAFIRQRDIDAQLRKNIMDERMDRMRGNDLLQEQIDLAREEKENDIAVAQEEREMKIEEDEEKRKEQKAQTQTPRELRLQSALKRQQREKEKDKRNNLKELVLMNLNDKSSNSLFG